MEAAQETFAPLGKYTVHDGYRVDGSKVRMWSTKAEAKKAAKSIGWPMYAVEKVHTRFCVAWALVSTGQGALSRDGYARLLNQ